MKCGAIPPLTPPPLLGPVGGGRGGVIELLTGTLTFKNAPPPLPHFQMGNFLFQWRGQFGNVKIQARNGTISETNGKENRVRKSAPRCPLTRGHTVPEQESNIGKKMTTKETWTFYLRRLLLFARLSYYFIPCLRLTKLSTLLPAPFWPALSKFP